MDSNTDGITENTESHQASSHDDSTLDSISSNQWRRPQRAAVHRANAKRKAYLALEPMCLLLSTFILLTMSGQLGGVCCELYFRIIIFIFVTLPHY